MKRFEEIKKPLLYKTLLLLFLLPYSQIADNDRILFLIELFFPLVAKPPSGQMVSTHDCMLGVWGAKLAWTLFVLLHECWKLYLPTLR